MNVGDIVYNQYHGIDRFGVVASARIADDGWKYVLVNWINDDKYKYAMSYRKKLTGTDYSLEEYRCDQIKAVDVDHWNSSLKAAKEESDNMVKR
jgi:hypothetical protein